MNTTQELVEIIESMLDKKGIKTAKMLKDCNLALALIDNMKNKQKGLPSADKIAKIAQYLGTTSEYLLGISDNPTPNATEPAPTNELLIIPDILKIATHKGDDGFTQYEIDRLAEFAEMLMLKRENDKKK